MTVEETSYSCLTLLTTSATLNGTSNPWPTTANIVLATFYSFLSVIIIVSNITNLLVLPHASVELGANTVYLFRALAFVDLNSGIFGSGGKIIDNALAPCVEGLIPYHSVKSILSVLCINYSLLILACVSVNRYLRIAKPYWYSAAVTRRKMNVVLVVVAVLGGLQGIGGYLLSIYTYADSEIPYCYFQVMDCNPHYPSFMVLYFFIPVVVTVVITFTNASLLRIVLDHKRRIKQQITVAQNGALMSPSPSLIHDHQQQQQAPRPKQVNVNGITTLMLVITTFYICCAPAVIYDSYFIATGGGDHLPEGINYFFTALLFSNSCMNSFIYLFTMNSFRRVVKRKLSCFSSSTGRHLQMGLTNDS